MRNAFRKMATDGKIDKYKFMACMRNLDVGVGQPKLIERLFHEIDDDNSGYLTFAEFSAGVEHPRDANTDIKIERNIPQNYLQNKTIGSALMGENPQENSRPNTPDDDNSSDVARPETDHETAAKPPVRQQLRSREARQRFQGWQRRFKGGGQVPMIFARPKPRRTTAAEQRAADLRRSQGQYPVSMYARAASMRPQSAYIANRPTTTSKKRTSQKRRPQSGRRLRVQGMGRPTQPFSATVAGGAGAYGAGRTVSPRMKKSNYFRSAPAAKLRKYQAKKNAASQKARLAAQLQQGISYTGSRGLVSSGDRKLDLTRLLGM